MIGPLRRTGRELRSAAREAHAAWGGRATAAVLLYVAAATIPLVAGGPLAAERLAEGTYLAVAALGLAVAVGAGLPSAGQGAFVGIGAFASAHAQAQLGAGFVVAALLGAAAATAFGLAVGIRIARLPALVLAVVTWLGSWLFALVLGAFPSLSGGAQGLVAEARGPTPRAHYELALALLAVGVLALFALRRAPFGRDADALRLRPGAALALGVPADRVRLTAFVVAAAAGGLAGGFSVHLIGVADPTSYGPFLSFQLLVAVLIGGAASALGAPVGMLVLGGASMLAAQLGSVEATSTGRYDRIFAALLVLAVLALGAGGIADWLGRLAPRRHSPFAAGGALHEPRPPAGPALVASGLSKRFGEVTAVDGLDLELRAGEVCALVGPNGSGKTTVLRMLAGAVPPDAGSIRLGGRELAATPVPDRVRLGVVRTLQPTAVFRGLTALDHALVGSARTRRYGGLPRALFLTPRYRAESRAARRAALDALDAVGLADAAETRVEELTGPEQRLVVLAAALATEPRVLLLDEPSAGAGPADVDRLAGVVRRLRERGLAVLLVEHNMQLVRDVGDSVVELAASGAPA